MSPSEHSASEPKPSAGGDNVPRQRHSRHKLSSSTELLKQHVELGPVKEQVGYDFDIPKQGEPTVRHQFSVHHVEQVKKQAETINPVLPLLLALVPAAASVIMGDNVGRFLTDCLLLTAVGWAVFSMRLAAWNYYYSITATGSGPKVWALFLYLTTPLLGGAVMSLARTHLSAGSKFITNFNIFLYLVLDVARGLVKSSQREEELKTASQQTDASNPSTMAMVNALKRDSAMFYNKIQQLEYALSNVQQQLSAVDQRAIDNEALLHHELYSIWKVMDNLKDMKQSGEQNETRLSPITPPNTTSSAVAVDGTKAAPRTSSHKSTLAAATEHSPDPVRQTLVQRSISMAMRPFTTVWHGVVFITLLVPFRVLNWLLTTTTHRETLNARA